MKSPHSLRTALSLAVALLFWSSAFAAIRVGLRGYSPGELALLRFAVASAALAVYALAARLRLPRVRDLPLLLLMGFLGFTVYHVALNMGEVVVEAGGAVSIGGVLALNRWGKVRRRIAEENAAGR